MSLTVEQLRLESSPRAVPHARRWVSEACRRLQREDLVESAVMATSELVTNAVLHAEPPFVIQLRGTQEHPRIEVLDGSARPPIPPSENHFDPMALLSMDELDDAALEAVLTTFGRGLSLVSMASVAWGAVVQTDSKVVWFEPSPEIDESGGPQPVIEFEAAPAAPPVPAQGVTVRWYGMDPMIFTAQRRQYFGLRRELRLLALAHGDQYPLASEMGALFPEFERHFPAAEFVRFPDRATENTPLVNVSLTLAPEAGPVCERMARLFEQADDFCRRELLLSVARTRAVRDFQTWFLGEAVAQLQGRPPRRWVAPATAHVG